MFASLLPCGNLPLANKMVSDDLTVGLILVFVTISTGAAEGVFRQLVHSTNSSGGEWKGRGEMEVDREETGEKRQLRAQREKRERKREAGFLFPLDDHNLSKRILKHIMPALFWQIQHSTDAGMLDSSPTRDSSTAGSCSLKEPQGHSFQQLTEALWSERRHFKPAASPTSLWVFSELSKVSSSNTQKRIPLIHRRRKSTQLSECHEGVKEKEGLEEREVATFLAWVFSHEVLPTAKLQIYSNVWETPCELLKLVN